MSTMLHLLLAVILTLFLVSQVGALAYLLRRRRARLAPRPPRPADLVWTSLPVLIVLLLAARSWVAALDVERPAAASAVAAPGAAGPAAGAPPEALRDAPGDPGHHGRRAGPAPEGQEPP